MPETSIFDGVLNTLERGLSMAIDWETRTNPVLANPSQQYVSAQQPVDQTTVADQRRGGFMGLSNNALMIGGAGVALVAVLLVLKK